VYFASRSVEIVMHRATYINLLCMNSVASRSSYIRYGTVGFNVPLDSSQVITSGYVGFSRRLYRVSVIYLFHIHREQQKKAIHRIHHHHYHRKNV